MVKVHGFEIIRALETHLKAVPRNFEFSFFGHRLLSSIIKT